MPDADGSRTLPATEYRERVRARQEALRACDRQHLISGYVRVGVGIAAVALTHLIINLQAISGWWLLGAAAAFWVLSARLQRLERERDRLNRAIEYYRRGIARLEGGWETTGETGARFGEEHHPYALDLDIFGPGSLFHFLNGARTRIGEETLAEWLNHPAGPPVVLARQEAVEELASKLDWREELAVLADKARTGVHAKELAEWGERPAVLSGSVSRGWIWMLTAFGAGAIVAAILAFVSWGGGIELSARQAAGVRLYLVAAILVFTFTRRRYRPRAAPVLAEAAAAWHDLELLAGVLRRIEQESFESPRLRWVRAQLDTEGQPPSRRMARLARVMEYADSLHHPWMGIIGTLLLWDVHVALALENWRRHSGSGLRRWLAAVGEIEALSSFAGFRWERPATTFPRFVSDPGCFAAEGIRHPLLAPATVVPNDLNLGGDTRIWIVSGSNMSGKSTLLRSAGCNAVLAQAGAPVCASSMRLSPLALGTSIRVQDSLQHGESRFYAEILRLRQIVDMASGPTPVLFLIDEFLHGTNSHDRRIGAEAIVLGLSRRGAIGLVTTHDLALTHIAEALTPPGANVHFEDHLEDGRMRFDYRMRPGVVQKSNAIELMRSIGLQV